MLLLVYCFLVAKLWSFYDPLDCSPPVSSVQRISQVRILEWVVIFLSRTSSWPRDWTHITCIGRQMLYTEPSRRPITFMFYHHCQNHPTWYYYFCCCFSEKINLKTTCLKKLWNSDLNQMYLILNCMRRWNIISNYYWPHAVSVVVCPVIWIFFQFYLKKLIDRPPRLVTPGPLTLHFISLTSLTSQQLPSQKQKLPGSFKREMSHSFISTVKGGD